MKILDTKKNLDTLSIQVPILISEEPIVAIYVDTIFDLPPIKLGIKYEWPKILLIVWPDGNVIWSENQSEGGPPYLKGIITKDKIDKFFYDINDIGIFKSPLRHYDFSYFGDYGSAKYARIFAVKDSNYIEMGSSHEFYDSEPNTAVLVRDRTNLDDSLSQKINSQRQEYYQEFKEYWFEIRKAAKILIPNEGQSAGDLNFELRDTSDVFLYLDN